VPSELQKRVEVHLAAEARLRAAAEGVDRSEALTAILEWEGSIKPVRDEIERMADWGFYRSGSRIYGLKGITRLGMSAEDVATEVVNKFLRELDAGRIERSASAAWLKTTCARQLIDLNGRAAREPSPLAETPEQESVDQSTADDWWISPAGPEQEVAARQLGDSLHEALEEAHQLIKRTRLAEPDQKRWLWQERRLSGKSWEKIFKSIPPDMKALESRELNTMQTWVTRYQQALAAQCKRLPPKYSAMLARLLERLENADSAEDADD